MKAEVLKGRKRNTIVHRGHVAIKDLPAVSRPNTFDLDPNPDGLPREVSDQHTDDAASARSGRQSLERAPAVLSDEPESSEPCAHPW